MEWLQGADANILLWLREIFSCAFLDKIMIGISILGDAGFLWIAMGVLFLVFGFQKKIWRKRGMVLLLSLGVDALLCNVILKPLVGRIRPYDLLGYDILIPPLNDPSFPSGHTAASFAAAAALYSMNRRWGIAAYIFSVLMGFSRVYLGVHFPTDVLCGALVGVIAAKLVLYFCKKVDFFKSDI